jgi:ParB family transcriptional regulator, chromosome partitioning protein
MTSAMRPADGFEAFKASIDEGKGVEEVAARFGVSVLTVVTPRARR